MRKLIFALILMLAMALASYGKRNDKDSDSVSSQIVAVKSFQMNTAFNNDLFMQPFFYCKGKKVTTFYNDKNNKLISFSIPVLANDLQAEIVEIMANKNVHVYVKK